MLGHYHTSLGHSLTCPSCGKPWASYTPVLLAGNRPQIGRKFCKLSFENFQPPELVVQSYKCFHEGGIFWSTVSPSREWEAPRLVSRQWFSVPSKIRWTWFTVLLIPATALSITYFAINFKALLRHHLTNPWSVGFAAPDPNSSLTGSITAEIYDIYDAAVVVNTPQVAFSMLYFMFNSTLTMMHTAHEWANFSIHRKALRVSAPKEFQCSTYWLQLPWTYSVPLILGSGSMHWLLGRSLYIVKVESYRHFGEREDWHDYFAPRYSLIPALLLVVVLTLLGTSIYILGFRKLPPIPFVRLDSLAIAAACHPDPSEKGLELQPLMWGELSRYVKDGKPQYSFSARPVNPPDGRNYQVPREIAFRPDIWPFNRTESIERASNGFAERPRAGYYAIR